ncbi:unnamed protein product [Ceutorhynchus assimilis]|uniref:Alpha-tubulin N-acetyltransferase n=1 Tax=Ceutorhynchus assimilis TaxID=467358 RepID=A0A9P0DNH5_9CUCU|nr:unnamed protein product [Ceutorhynchus assimilis]
MEFRFNLNELFQEPCVEIGNTLIPPGFAGDKRALWDTQSKVTQIVNAIGEASAHAQGLTKPITTADRLRNSEHRLYLLIDQAANNGKGAVTGMLKTGEKGLYVFDREGQHYQVSPPCVLDFYIHESRQRTGFGRRLFEHMLEREQLEPNKMAIDRPSDKFLGFLNKHYGLNTPVKQMNNYVVFDGFFPKHAGTPNKIPTDKSNTPTKRQSANGLQQSFNSSPYGRYAAAHPACSMGQIIHNDSPVINRNQEPTGVKSEPVVVTQGGIDQYNNVYGNQLAWQTTQSVPNMPFVQNQYPYNQQNAIPQNPNYYYMAQGDATNQTYNYFPQNEQISTPQVAQQLQRTREPLIPQSFDGTPRKMPHAAQSMPAQGDRRQIPAPFVLQNSISAPNNYQQAFVNNVVQQQIQSESNNQMMQNQNQPTPGVTQQSYNDGTNQMNPMSNQNHQANLGVSQMINQNQSNPQMNPMTNPNQANLVGGSQMVNQNQLNPQMNQMTNQNQSNSQVNPMTNQNQANLVGGSQMVPTMINQNPSNSQFPQMNPMTNQHQTNLVGGSQMVSTNQNQSNPGVSQINSMANHNQANLVGGTQMVTTMINPNQSNPQMNPMTNQNQANLVGSSQMVPTMTNQNQSNPGVSHMNPMITQNQANLVGGSQMVPIMINPNQSNPRMNPMTNQNQANLVGGSQMVPIMPNQNQPISRDQNSAVINPNQINPALNQNPSQMNQVTTQADNQNNMTPSMVDQNQNGQQVMPNTVQAQQQPINNQVGTYPQMFNQFDNSINNQKSQQPSQSNAAPQPVREDVRVPYYQNEVDISKGYPPQQLQTPVASSARPPIIVRD